MNKKLVWLTTSVFFLFIVSYFLIINHLFPVSSDDFVFALDFSGVQNPLGLILTHVQKIYLTWSGRLSVTFVEYVLLPFVPIFNLLNPLVFCTFIYGVFLNSALRPIKTLHDTLTLIFIFFIVWFFIPEFAEAAIWKTGSLSYLWPMTLCLFIIYPFIKLLIKNEDIISGRKIKFIFLAIGALLLGTTHELLTVSIGCLLLVTNFLCHLRNKKIPIWSVVTTILFFIATIILIIAPGNHARSETMGIHPSFLSKLYTLVFAICEHYLKLNKSLPLGLLLLTVIFLLSFEKITTHKILRVIFVELILFSAFFMIIPISFKFYVLNILILAILIGVTIVLNLRHRQKQLSLAVTFILLILLTIFTVMGAPFIMFGDRTSFFSDTFFIIAMVSIIANRDFLKRWSLTYQVFCVTTLLFLIPSMISNYHETVFYKQQVVKRQQLLSIYKDNNAPIFLQYLTPNEVNSPNDPNIFVYNPHIIIRDFMEKDLMSIYHLSQVTIRPFVELWSNLSKSINPQQASTHFSTFTANRTLYYVSTRGSCDMIPNKHPFLLQVYPANPFVLGPALRQRGYESFEFEWQKDNRVTVISDDGKEKNDVCVFAISLPNYASSMIITGQYSIINGNKVLDWKN